VNFRIGKMAAQITDCGKKCRMSPREDNLTMRIFMMDIYILASTPPDVGRPNTGTLASASTCKNAYPEQQIQCLRYQQN